MNENAKAATATRWLTFLWTIGTVLVLAQHADAHIVAGESGGFLSGLKHPWSGWDHICAMVSVGLWGAQLGMPAIWVLPVTFPVIMAMGGFLGLIGFRFPGDQIGDEIGIAASAIMLGAVVLLAVRPKLAIAMVLVGFFGLCHGYAHGRELPPGQSGMLYSIGFVIATGTLHAVGITFGLIHRWRGGRVLIRVVGGAVTAAGFYFLVQAFHEEPEAAPKPAAATATVVQPSIGVVG
jgi:urease accessory protein